ncbi:MAG: GNAT family N-acetyltransferase [Clostridia bacterium]|jgi:GNAT superfamily N-acetyltransferase|nr:GNAT family N-acetyltransferase [Clostridiaceae bacterium]
MTDTIKEAVTYEDAKALSRLAFKIWREHYTPIIGKDQTEYMLENFQSEEKIFDSMQNGMVYYMVFCDDILCGYAAAMYTDRDNSVFLSKFYIEKLYRGKGLSKKLLEKVKNFAYGRKAQSIWLTCNKYNSLALSVYKKLGFEIIDSIETDIGEGYIMDDYVLEMKLSTSP